MNIPNIISLVRLLATPLIVWLVLSGEWTWSFFLFVAAGVSDAIDGFIAKRFNAATKVGAYLDPIADKVLLVAIYVAMGVSGLLPLWLVILVVSRDFLIVGGALLLYTLEFELEIRPIWTSKVNTFMQIGLAGLVLAAHAFTWSVPPLDRLVALCAYRDYHDYLRRRLSDKLDPASHGGRTTVTL